MSRPVRYLSLLAAALVAAQCGSNPTVPTPPPTQNPPQITCPMPQMVVSQTDTPASVAYGSASVIGGTPPVTITCDPASGSVFQVGQTTVTCTAVDQQQRRDSCQFTVTVAPPPKIKDTKFGAFGDSITQGEDGTTSLFVRQTIIGTAAYPYVLQQELAARYLAQSIVVTNMGNHGEQAESDSAYSRFQLMLQTNDVQVILIMEGSNDLDLSDTSTIPAAIAGLGRMIDYAKGDGVVPYLATIPPMNPADFRGGNASLVDGFNEQVRDLANSKGITLVDVNKAFNGNLGLISQDGLHPTSAGYQKIADTFYASLKATLEVTQ